MNRYQKLAWWNIIVITFTIIITTAAIVIEFRIRGFSTLGIYFIAPLVLLKFNRFLFKKPQSKRGVVSDERDSIIVKRAVSFAYTVFWIVFILSSFLLFVLLGPRSSVPTITLLLMALGGGIFMKIICSVAILVQYGRIGKGEKL
jgi:hypothetical protein